MSIDHPNCMMAILLNADWWDLIDWRKGTLVGCYWISAYKSCPQGRDLKSLKFTFFSAFQTRTGPSSGVRGTASVTGIFEVSYDPSVYTSGTAAENAELQERNWRERQVSRYAGIWEHSKRIIVVPSEGCLWKLFCSSDHVLWRVLS